jgi:hypothetical protein
MSLVLLFNTVQTLSVNEMAGQTGLGIPDVLRSVKVGECGHFTFGVIDIVISNLSP